MEKLRTIYKDSANTTIGHPQSKKFVLRVALKARAVDGFRSIVDDFIRWFCQSLDELLDDRNSDDLLDNLRFYHGLDTFAGI